MADAFDPNAFLAQQGAQAPQATPQAPAVGGTSGFNPDQFLSDNNQEEHGTAGEMLKTGAEGALSAATFGVGNKVEADILGNKDEQLARMNANPISHGVGEAAGLVGSSLLVPGGGAAGVLGKVGEAATEAVGLAAPATYAAKVGSAAVQQAAEMAVLQGSDETAKMLLQDPDTSAETAISNIGLASALGAAGGAFVSGAVVPLWEATAKAPIESFLSTFRNHLNGGTALPEDLTQAASTLGMDLSPELKAANKSAGARDTYTTLKEAQNSKILGQEADMNQHIGNSILESTGLPVEDFHNYSQADAGRSGMEAFKKEYRDQYAPIGKEFNDITSKFEGMPASDGRIGEIADKIVQKGYERGWIGKDLPQNEIVDAALSRLPKVKTAADMKQMITEIGNIAQSNPQALSRPAGEIINELMEGQHNIIGDSIQENAPELIGRYSAARQNYANFARTSNELAGELNLGKYHGPESFMKALEAKRTPEQFLSRLSPSGNAEILPFLEKNFPNTLEHIRSSELKDIVGPAVRAAKGDEAINLKVLNSKLAKLKAGQPELLKFAVPQQLLDRASAAETVLNSVPSIRSSGTAGWIEKMTKHVPQSAFAALAYLEGHNPLMGGLIGHGVQLMRRNVPDAMRLAMLRFVASDQPIEAAGFKAMVDMMHNTIQGQSALTKAVTNVFKGGTPALISSAMPTADHRDKLDKIVTKAAQDPNVLMNLTNGNTGHYLPKHQVALTQNVTQQVQYLSSLKPGSTQAGPLDKKIAANPAQEARYNRALDIANQPLAVMNHIKNGTIQQTDIIDLKSMYPNVYAQMTQKLSNEITNAQHDQEPIPYKTRVGLSIFLGQPLDTSMTPSSIQAAQMSLKPQQPPQQAGASKPKAKSSTNLMKGADSYKTPGQAAEGDRSSRD